MKIKYVKPSRDTVPLNHQLACILHLREKSGVLSIFKVFCVYGLHSFSCFCVTSLQVLQHSWVVSRYQLPVHRLHQVSSVSRIKEAVKATFSALSSPDNKRLKPVNASLLAQRRTTKKSPK